MVQGLLLLRAFLWWLFYRRSKPSKDNAESAILRMETRMQWAEIDRLRSQVNALTELTRTQSRELRRVRHERDDGGD